MARLFARIVTGDGSIPLLTRPVNMFTVPLLWSRKDTAPMVMSLRRQVLVAARALFMERGYEAVGMREIALAVGKLPVQIYRLKLSKSDILAEVIIELNQEQIEAVPKLCSGVKGVSVFERTCYYLRELYALDIQYLPIRSMGAAYGWLWSASYEKIVIEQVHQLVSPVIGWMQEAKLDDIQGRCIGIWSLYYVGYRHAVMHGGSADDCLAGIKPSLRYFFEEQRTEQ